MYESLSATLPATDYAKYRSAEIEYSHHGDIILSFSQKPTEESDEYNTTFQMAHGNESILLGSMIGYYKRLGKSSKQTRMDFTKAGSLILEKERQDTQKSRRPQHSRTLSALANGRRAPRFDNQAMGWDRLTPDIPTQPGIIENVGGTAIYTRTDLFGNQTMLLAHIRPLFDWGLREERPKQASFDLFEHDIPVLAKLVCEQSAGEYRKDVLWLLNQL